MGQRTGIVAHWAVHIDREARRQVGEHAERTQRHAIPNRGAHNTWQSSKPRSQPLLCRLKPRRQPLLCRLKPRRQPLLCRVRPRRQPLLCRLKPRRQPLLCRLGPRRQPLLCRLRPRRRWQTSNGRLILSSLAQLAHMSPSVNEM